MQAHICMYSPNDDSVGLALHGEFDISNAQQLADCVGRAARSAEWRTIEVDLSRVQFLGVAPVAVLVRLAAEATAAGCCLTVTAASRPAQRTLDLTGAAEAIVRLTESRRHSAREVPPHRGRHTTEI